MIVRLTATPPNALLLVMDDRIGVVPETMAGQTIAATASCVAVGTLSEHDGTTAITVADENVSVEDHLAFSGMLETPSQVLSVMTVLGETLAEIKLSSETTRVEIWTDDPIEPGKITILVTPHNDEV